MWTCIRTPGIRKNTKFICTDYITVPKRSSLQLHHFLIGLYLSFLTPPPLPPVCFIPLSFNMSSQEVVSAAGGGVGGGGGGEGGGGSVSSDVL